MHLLIIIILFCVLFPVFGRLVGWVISTICWIVAVVVVLALFGALATDRRHTEAAERRINILPTLDRNHHEQSHPETPP